MEYSMYVCPKCRRTFKVKGMDMRARCADCADTYLKDMHLDAELWKSFTMSQRTKAVNYTVGAPGGSAGDAHKAEQAERRPDPVRTVTDRRDTVSQKNVTSVDRSGFREYKCPNCNARLSISGNTDKATCEYCGAVFMINDAGNRSGREGSEVNEGSLEELLSGISTMLAAVKKKDELREKIDAAEEKESSVRAEYDKCSSFLYSLIPFGIAGFIVLIPLFGLFDSSAGIVKRIIALLIGAGLGYLAVMLGRKFISGKISSLEVQLAAIENKLRDLNEQYEGVRGTDEIKAIPEQYRTAEALGCMYEYLASGRALNIRQAITLYEDKKKNDEIMRMHKEQIEFQRKEIEELKRMGNSSSGSDSDLASAIGSSVVRGVATAVTFSVLKDLKDDLF